MKKKVNNQPMSIKVSLVSVTFAACFTNLTFSIADSVSMSPSVHIETDTLLFFIANSCPSAPKKPFKANFVEVYGATNGLDILPVNHQ